MAGIVRPIRCDASESRQGSATSYRKSPIQRLYLCDPALDCKTDRIGAGALTHRRSTLIVIRKARDRERQTLDERP